MRERLRVIFFLQSLLEAHDKIAEKYESQEAGPSKGGGGEAPWEEIRPAGSILKHSKHGTTTASNMSVDSEDSNVQYAQPIRIISLRKSPTQPLVSRDNHTHTLCGYHMIILSRG
jgi:hypothetical protein